MARGGGGHSGGGSRGGGGFSSSSSRGSRGFSSSSGSRGGRSSYSSGSRGGFSSGNRAGSGFGGSRPGGPAGVGPRPGGPGPSMGGGYRPRNPRPIMGGPIFVSTPRGRRRSGGGCGTSLVSMIAMIMILMILFSAISSVGGSKQSYNDYDDSTKIVSTVEREALPSGSVNETGYYTDNLGWIQRSSALTSGMKKFYKETGVQPYLYLASEEEIAEYGSLQNLAESVYDELFTDEAHFLFAFTEDEKTYDWDIWFVTGTQATAVIDDEAEEIIYQYFVRYYESDLEDEEFFSTVFEKSAELMMEHVTNGFDVAKVAIMIGGGVAIIGIVIYGVNKSKKIKLEREKEQNEFTEKMMNVPLDTFGEAETDKELEELMKKYKENESK